MKPRITATAVLNQRGEREFCVVNECGLIICTRPTMESATDRAIALNAIGGTWGETFDRKGRAQVVWIAA